MRLRVVLLLTILLGPFSLIDSAKARSFRPDCSQHRPNGCDAIARTALALEFARPTSAVASATGANDVHANALWAPPTGVLDLFYGPWGARSQPDPNAVYTFVRRKQKGTNPGMVVRDPQGREWHVKQTRTNGIHPEGPVEVVVSRVLSAVGYRQPPVYYLPSFRLADGKGTHIEPGGRFRVDDPSLRNVGNWSWDDPTVKGSRPYNGLLVILLAFASWDLKQSNNCIYQVQNNGRVESWYVVRDLGAAFGSEGTLRATKNDIGKFEQQGFIRGVSNGYVEFEYGGKRQDLYRRRITVDDVRWAMGLLSSLDARQWREAFRAGGYPSDLSDQFIRKIQANIRDGQRLASDPRTLAKMKW
jgi:hypothetical protein